MSNKIDQISESMGDQALNRIAAALEKLAFGAVQTGQEQSGNSKHQAYVWQPETRHLKAIDQVNRVPLDLLMGVERPRNLLLENTRRFATGLPANNALLWGARGMGKSSMVKAIHAHLVDQQIGDQPLELIEIGRTDIASLGELNEALSERAAQCLIYCDDLSFDYDDTAYKSLKTVLDGGLAGRPANVLFYATSNRRHLMPRDMIDNETGSAINPGEAVEEKLSLSDRFGLWLGFHKCDQPTYLGMIAAYAEHFGIPGNPEDWRADALEWQVTRGSRSGRVAWQFVQQLAGDKGIRI